MSKNERLAYSNSAAALKYSKLNQYPMIEVDVEYDEDGNLICCHGENVNKEKNELYDAERLADVKVQSLEQFFYSVRGTNAMIVLDAKGTNIDILVYLLYRDVFLLAEKIGGKRLLDQLIPQVYSLEQLESFHEIYDCPCMIFTMYRYDLSNENSFYTLMQKISQYKNVTSITIPKDILTESMVLEVHKYNKFVYTHTVDDLSELMLLENTGIDGFYTDFITPKEYYDWKHMENPFFNCLPAKLDLYFADEDGQESDDTSDEM